MAKLMECIPNISEGRRLDLVEEFADIVRAVPGVTLIDYSSDASHNRSVFTFLGDPDQVMEAAFRFAQHAVEKIDLRVHEGEHPRMGAVDVIPFVPIRDMDMQECVERSKVLGERLAKRNGDCGRDGGWTRFGACAWNDKNDCRLGCEIGKK